MSLFNTVVFEGGDQVGKADAVLNFTKKMNEIHIPTIYSSFPIYASPLGTVIRRVLKGGLECVFTKEIDQLRLLEIKMALYALDRLQFMEVILSNPKYKNRLVLLDRGPYSNAVTIAYGIATVKGIGSDTIEKLVDIALDLESFMINTLGLPNCTVQLISKDHCWENIRSGNVDRNEQRDVQEKCDFAYSLYKKRVGKGWKQVVTRDKDGWFDRGEIFEEINSFVQRQYPDLARKEEAAGIYDIGIEELLSSIYIDCAVKKRDLSKYIDALKSNDKDTMYEYGSYAGESIGKTCKRINIQNMEVKEEYSKIFKRYPETLEVISYYLSGEYASNLLDSVSK